MFIGLFALGLVAISGSKAMAQDLIVIDSEYTLFCENNVCIYVKVDEKKYLLAEQEAWNQVLQMAINQTNDGCARFDALVQKGIQQHSPLEFLTCKGGVGEALCPCRTIVQGYDSNGNLLSETTVDASQ